MTKMMTMTLQAAGLAGAVTASAAVARATFAMRRGTGFLIFAGGVAVLIVQAIVRLHGG